MSRCWMLLSFCLMAVGCGGSAPPAPPTTPATQASDIQGEWELIGINDLPIRKKDIKYYYLTIKPDGTWETKAVLVGLGSNEITSHGTWSFADGIVTYAQGSADSKESQIFVGDGRMLLKPDLTLNLEEGRAVTQFKKRKL